MNASLQEIKLNKDLSQELESIYIEMEESYQDVASQIGLSCQGCSDNCCDSWFQHHTYAEWAWLWQGLSELPSEKLETIKNKANDYIKKTNKAIQEQKQPQTPCPLLADDGLCTLYQHRLLVCRMHGVPASMTRPDGQKISFPGCFRCQEICEEKHQLESDIPRMDRTRLFQRMAILEHNLLYGKRHLFPKVKKTIAEMIIAGPPVLPVGCQPEQQI